MQAAGAASTPGPASLSPDIEESLRREPAPIFRSLPTTVNPPRGTSEVVVPIDGRVGPLLPGGGRND